MKIKVEEKNNSISSSKNMVITIAGVGLQGAKGADGKNAYPDDGNIGELLEKQSNGVGWTSQPINLTLSGGNF